MTEIGPIRTCGAVNVPQVQHATLSLMVGELTEFKQESRWELQSLSTARLLAQLSISLFVISMMYNQT